MGDLVSDALALRVHAIADVARGIRLFDLRALDGAPLPPFGAGDHVDIATPAGPVRQYSLCNDPADRERYCVAVKLEDDSRGGSASMHRDVQAGQVLRVGRPRSNFPLGPADACLLAAGGIGVTPLLAMVHQLERQGVPTALHYFIRGPEHAAFLDELAVPRRHVRVTLHEALAPADVSARLREAAERSPRGVQAYVCGPGPFMAAARDELVPRLGDEAVHFEYFQPRDDGEGPAATGGDTAFRAHLARSNIDVTVGPDETLLEALARSGCAVPTSCQQGVCGTCVVKVLSGVPDHRDSFLSDFHRKANKKIATCVSRSLTDVIELDL